MLLTGQEYLESIRDGRRVYVGSELVDDVTTHPAFRNAARSFALIYDRKRAAENRAVMTFEEDGETFSSYFLLPRTNVRTALRQFSEAEEESLPVLDNPTSRKVVGYLTEAYALRRYNQELERQRSDELGTKYLYGSD